jgi:hypothetical protein
LRSEIVFPRASATGYHRFNVIRQIGGNLVRKVDRLVRKKMAVDSPTEEVSGGKAAKISQRVEDNAFHLVSCELTHVRFADESR